MLAKVLVVPSGKVQLTGSKISLQAPMLVIRGVQPVAPEQVAKHWLAKTLVDPSAAVHTTGSQS
jgi:hypothetical protein